MNKKILYRCNKCGLERFATHNQDGYYCPEMDMDTGRWLCDGVMEPVQPLQFQSSAPKARIDDRIYCVDCERGVGCPDWDPPDGWCKAGIQSSTPKVKTDE